ncbi:MAG TPA: ATP-binding protein [Acidimicrobiales bacterium]|nr:ATP-binding protein [Acidimicrobiales bacterium]
MSRLPPREPAFAPGLLVGVGLCAAVTIGLVPVRSSTSPATPALLLVVPVVAGAVFGGRRAALVTAAVAAALYNVAFLRPYWTVKVAIVEDAVALGVFAAVAGVVGTLVAREEARRRTVDLATEELSSLHNRYEVVEAERERLAEEANRLAVLEQVDHQRSAMLRSVSHDLRTPLATIRAVTSDLGGGAAYDEATKQELLALVGDEAERLDRIVANLLDLSRIEAGGLRPKRQAVALDELVANRVRRLSRLFRQVRVQVDLPDDLPLVDADYTQVDQVLSNLLENAARHAPPRTTVRIDARARDGMVEVTVADEGVGVARFERERIFEPFRRGDGSSSSGVGLAICRAIVEAHGGTIDVEPAPGGGARFSFTLPVRRG